MIFRRLALALAAAACLATAAGVAVVALAYAFFALLRDEAGLSAAASSACVVGLAAALILIAALVLKQAASGHGHHRRHGGGHADLADTLADLVRDRPIAATAVAAVAGWVMTRNPALARTLETIISRRGRGDRR